MRLILLFFIGFSFLSNLSAQSYLRASSPDDWATTITAVDPDWHEYLAPAEIDEFTYFINPQGIYTQVELFVTISQGYAEPWWSNDMEIIWQFRLPQQAIVHDSWLWVEDEIVKADVVDFWTASQIYEDIVDRNQDPSLLYQLPNGSYEIRIYPLFHGESRRIKMSFLLPNDWSENRVSTDLILPFLQSTDLVPESIEIVMPQNEEWINPQIILSGGTTSAYDFSEEVSTNYGEIHYLDLPLAGVSNWTSLHLETDSPWQTSETPVYLKVFEDSGENFYQLAFLPDFGDVPQDADHEKVLILIDREENKTNVSKQELIDAVNTQIFPAHSEADSLIFMFSTPAGTETLPGDSWMSFDSQEAQTALTTYLAAAEMSDLQTLLSEAYNQAAMDEAITEIILFSANDAFVHPTDADEFYDAISSEVSTEVPLNIYDLQTENVSVIYDGDEVHTGNSYLFDILTSQSNGQLSNLRDQEAALSTVLSGDYPAFTGNNGLFSVDVDLAEGVVFQEQNLFSSHYNSEANQVIYQTGRFVGDFPMEVEASLITDEGNFYTYDLELESNPGTDTLMREMWYGNYLRQEALVVEDNEETLALIAQSIEERVLIPQTAFLALEPGMGGTVCVPCLDSGGGIFINNNNEENESYDFQVAPNPAVSQVQIICSNTNQTEDAKVEIFDVQGKLLTDISSSLSQQGRKSTWTWNITENVIPGIYLCKIKMNGELITEKISVVR